MINFITFQVNRTVLHYAARCQDENIRNEISEICIANGADKFARDAFGNDSEYYLTNEFPKIGSVGDKAPPENNGEAEAEIVEDNSPTIENAIQEKDYDKLVKYVLEGNQLKDKIKKLCPKSRKEIF